MTGPPPLKDAKNLANKILHEKKKAKEKRHPFPEETKEACRQHRLPNFTKRESIWLKMQNCDTPSVPFQMKHFFLASSKNSFTVSVRLETVKEEMKMRA